MTTQKASAEQIKRRFESRFVTEPMCGCWLWLGAPKGDDGYGAFRMNGPQLRSHRAAWLIYVGDIPEGMQILHRCDNTACVNPSHLFLGTNADNVADRVSKFRSGGEAHPGEKHPLARLKESDVRTIRSRRAAGEHLRNLAEEFAISIPHACAIVNRKKWVHV